MFRFFDRFKLPVSPNKKSILGNPQGSFEASALKPKNLGLQWQLKLSEDRYIDSLPSIRTPGEMALLRTNEYFDLDLLKQQVPDANGYICGVGFGNILSLITLFDKERLPRGIICIDVMPEVVLFGRIFIELLKSCDTFDVFINRLTDVNFLDNLKASIIEAEGLEKIKDLFRSVDINDIINEISNEIGIIPRRGYINIGMKSKISVLGVIKERFMDFRNLALAGNIGISLGDATDRNVIEQMNKLDDFDKVKNIIYLTNIIDHITQRGAVLGINNSLLSLLSSIYSGIKGNNYYIDTTATLDYRLRVTNKPPEYQLDEVIRPYS